MHAASQPLSGTMMWRLTKLCETRIHATLHCLEPRGANTHEYRRLLVAHPRPKSPRCQPDNVMGVS